LPLLLAFYLLVQPLLQDIHPQLWQSMFSLGDYWRLLCLIYRLDIMLSKGHARSLSRQLLLPPLLDERFGEQ
jgi:hypothetical protein